MKKSITTDHKMSMKLLFVQQIISPNYNSSSWASTSALDLIKKLSKKIITQVCGDNKIKNIDLLGEKILHIGTILNFLICLMKDVYFTSLFDQDL